MPTQLSFNECKALMEANVDAFRAVHLGMRVALIIITTVEENRRKQADTKTGDLNQGT